MIVLPFATTAPPVVEPDPDLMVTLTPFRTRFAVGLGGYRSRVSADPVTARFPAQRASVSSARQFVTDTLVDAGVTSVLDDARLLISELATNAVVHAATDFSVSVHILAGRLYVEVRDGDPTDLAVERESPEPALSGQGLKIVRRLADSWGSRVEDHGKVVWFSVEA
jgi:anti-sigma regulatory factor (Ser/Thr protein kinase)